MGLRGPKPGSRKTGGRKKGTPNAKTCLSVKHLAEKLAAEGETPLEYMIRIMRTPQPQQLPGEETAHYMNRCKEHLAMTFDAAKSAAPYIHPKLQTTVLASDPDKPLKVELDIQEGARRIAFALAKAARQQGA